MERVARGKLQPDGDGSWRNAGQRPVLSEAPLKAGPGSRDARSEPSRTDAPAEGNLRHAHFIMLALVID